MANGLTPAIVLAAGRSERLGQPKALVVWGGRTLVEHAVEQLRVAGCEPVLVVTRPDLATAVRKRVGHMALVVVNEQPEAGRTGSLQCGLRSLQPYLHATDQRVVMAPVDRPGWSVETLHTLLAHDGCVAPRSAGRQGHPILLTHDGISSVMKAGPDQPLRDLLTFSPVLVNAPLLHLNVDRPEDLSLLKEVEADFVTYAKQGEGI